MLAMSRIEQLEVEIKTKNEAFEMKEAAWKSKVGFKINEHNVIMGRHVSENTWPIAESLFRLCVQEEGVVDESGRQVSSLDGQLDDCLSLLSELGEVWGDG